MGKAPQDGKGPTRNNRNNVVLKRSCYFTKRNGCRDEHEEGKALAMPLYLTKITVHETTKK